MAASPEIAARRPVPPWRQKVASFWRWWTAELAQAMPERLALLRGATRAPQVSIENGELILVEPRSAVSSDARVALGSLDPARARSAVSALLERAGETRGRARLCLVHREALVRRVTMPAATEENLRQVLAFEMDRLTPFRADDVYFDYRVAARDPAAATLGVQIAVARRDVVDAGVEMLRSLGVSVQGVTVRDDLTGSAQPLDLLPLEQRGQREGAQERAIKRVLAVAVALLFIAVLVYPIYRKREAVIALLPQVGKAQAEADSTDAIARELERQVADYNFLLSKKHGSPPAMAYIEDVTRLMPDNTWVQQFDLKQAGKTREVQITGETTSSSRLIEIMEQSQLLKSAQTRGTITRGSQPGSERFMIAAEVKPTAAPEPSPVGDAPAAPGAAAAAKPPAAPAPTPAPAPAAAPAPAKVQPVAPNPDPKADPKTASRPEPGK